MASAGCEDAGAEVVDCFTASSIGVSRSTSEFRREGCTKDSAIYEAPSEGMHMK